MSKQMKTHWETQEHFHGVQRCSYNSKTWLKLELTRDIKNYKKLLNDNQKQKENTILLLNKRGESVTKYAEKGEILSTSFTSLCTSTARHGEQKSMLK